MVNRNDATTGGAAFPKRFWRPVFPGFNPGNLPLFAAKLPMSFASLRAFSLRIRLTIISGYLRPGRRAPRPALTITYIP